MKQWSFGPIDGSGKVLFGTEPLLDIHVLLVMIGWLVLRPMDHMLGRLVVFVRRFRSHSVVVLWVGWHVIGHPWRGWR